MKSKLQSRICLTALNLLLVSLLPARSQEAGRPYFDGDIGGTILPDTDLEEYFGQDTSGREVKFDPGIRFGLRGGYGVTDWFAGEIETGLMINSIDSITGASEADAWMSNVPFLINARFQLSKFDLLTPYFGVGLGFSITGLDADDIVINGGLLDGYMSTVVFAYQGFAGLRCKINQNMGLSLEYRYFATTEPEWEADVVFGPAASDNVRFGRIQSHVLSIAFQYRF
jgi:opacity protein-like surface antigen